MKEKYVVIESRGYGIQYEVASGLSLEEATLKAEELNQTALQENNVNGNGDTYHYFVQ